MFDKNITNLNEKHKIEVNKPSLLHQTTENIFLSFWDLKTTKNMHYLLWKIFAFRLSSLFIKIRELFRYTKTVKTVEKISSKM